MTKIYTVIDANNNTVQITESVDRNNRATPESLQYNIDQIDEEIARLTAVKADLVTDLTEVNAALAA